MLYLEIVFIVLLIVGNGVLAMSELALVSSRRSRLEHLAEHGDRGARAALRLIEEFPELVKGANVVLMPAEMSGIIGTATAALSAINSGRTLAEAKQAEVVVEPTGQQGDDQTKG
mgnify:CR=1 FL=1